MFRKRQAALFENSRFLGRPEDFRVGEFHGVRLFPLLRYVDDEHALRDPDLWCGEADTGRGIHRFQHVAHEAADLVVHLLDRV